jgi:hypothetical protein
MVEKPNEIGGIGAGGSVEAYAITIGVATLIGM